MVQTIDPQVLRGFHRGMSDDSVLADSLMSPGQMRHIMNMDADVLGYLTGRKGYERLGSAAVVASTAGQGLLHHIGTNSQIIAFINGQSYYLVGSTWTLKSLGYSTSAKIRSVSFLNRVMAVDGATESRSWTGASGDAWGTTNLIGAPIGNFIETYKQQVYIGSSSTDQINFSSIPTSGAISWSAADNFQVNPNDGANMTGLKRYGKELLIFKKNFTYRFNGRSVDADPVIKYGAASQEGIIVEAGVCWFYDPVNNAVVAYSGGYPQIVSKPVRSFLAAIPTSARDDVALRGDFDHVEAFIGNVTVGGIALSNVSARYIISSQSWTLRSYANSFTVFGPYDNDTTLFSLGFTSNGNVVKMDTGNDDLGTNINYDLQTAWITIGNNPAVNQKLGAFSTFIENSRTMSVSYKTDSDPTWRPIGQANKYVTSWSGINCSFHRIKFRFTGTSSGDPAIFDGFSMLIPVIEGLERNTDK